MTWCVSGSAMISSAKRSIIAACSAVQDPASFAVTSVPGTLDFDLRLLSQGALRHDHPSGTNSGIDSAW